MADQNSQRIACFCALCVSRCGAIATVTDGIRAGRQPSGPGEVEQYAAAGVVSGQHGWCDQCEKIGTQATRLTIVRAPISIC